MQAYAIMDYCKEVTPVVKKILHEVQLVGRGYSLQEETTLQGPFICGEVGRVMYDLLEKAGFKTHAVQVQLDLTYPANDHFFPVVTTQEGLVIVDGSYLQFLAPLNLERGSLQDIQVIPLDFIDDFVSSIVYRRNTRLREAENPSLIRSSIPLYAMDDEELFTYLRRLWDVSNSKRFDRNPLVQEMASIEAGFPQGPRAGRLVQVLEEQGHISLRDRAA